MTLNKITNKRQTLNSKTALGNVPISVDEYNKVVEAHNELITTVNNLEIPKTKIEYVAAFQQTTDGDPTPFVTKNNLADAGYSLGDWSRTSVGLYKATATGLGFSYAGYYSVKIACSEQSGSKCRFATFTASGLEGEVWEIRCYNAAGTLVDTNILYLTVELLK